MHRAVEQGRAAGRGNPHRAVTVGLIVDVDIGGERFKQPARWSSASPTASPRALPSTIWSLRLSILSRVLLMVVTDVVIAFVGGKPGVLNRVRGGLDLSGGIYQRFHHRRFVVRA